jgi:DNA-binding LacI/PurR family transcriptional regulator
MERASFKDNEVEELATRFMRELNNMWVTLSVPDNQKLFNFDEIYDFAFTTTPPITTFEPTNRELRNAVEGLLIRRNLIEFVNDRQIRRVS